MPVSRICARPAGQRLRPPRRTAAAHTLWFDAPAQEFTQALPLGNGKLGAMCYGGTRQSRIQLNDATAWSGSPGSEAANGPGRGDGPDLVARAREALAAGEHAAAEVELAKLSTAHTQSYLPFAELLLELDFGDQPDPGTDEEPAHPESPHPEPALHYRRSLDLRSAVHEHSYTVAGRTITGQAYISVAHQVLVVELQVAGGRLPKVTASLVSPLRVAATTVGPGTLGLDLRLPTDVAPSHANPPTGVQYDQPGRESLRGAVVAHWQHDGTELNGAEHDGAELRDTELHDGGTLAAAGVSRLRLVVSAGTNFAGPGQAPEPGSSGAAPRRSHLSPTRPARSRRTGCWPVKRRSNPWSCWLTALQPSHPEVRCRASCCRCRPHPGSWQ